MKIDITQVPLSVSESYLAVSKFDEAGLCLRSVHGTGYMPGITMMKGIPFCAQIVPVCGAQEIAYQIDAKTDEIMVDTECGIIKICFANADTLLIHGEGKDLGVELRLSKGNFLQELSFQSEPYMMMNCRANDRRLAVRNQTGLLSAQMPDRIRYSSVDGQFQISVEDVNQGWKIMHHEYDYEECRRLSKEKEEAFRASLPVLSDEWEEAGKLASYVMWSGIVRKEGLLTRNAMLMAKNQMCNVWSWDHCFNAIALSYQNPELAWEQFMLLFDYQDEMGALPDSVSDAYIARAFCKPPIHGWALAKLMEHMELSETQYQEAYEKLENWTMWWLNYRDRDEDGICEYGHGHDSGWDNATVFRQEANMELPDLSAFLIIQMEVLSQLAEKLGNKSAAYWREKAERMMADMLEHCFEEGKPTALVSKSHQKIENDCLILYIPVILGKRLPEYVQKHMIDILKNGDFLTEYGFASEAVTSSYYEKDGYWRGPIWAPSTMLLIDGLYQMGETEFAKDVAERFCRMVSQSGCAENYDALTGEGLRDRAYTWTASVFMILAHEYGKH